MAKKNSEPLPRAASSRENRRRIREFATELEATRFAEVLGLKGLGTIIHHPATSLKKRWAVAW